MKQTNLEVALSELGTLRDMVRWGASQFNAACLGFGHGFDNAWDEALFLARHALHLTPNDDAYAADAQLLLAERRQILALYQRRIRERKPAAYLTREAWFAGFPFYVDERVLIPRSPIAELIEQRFSPWLDQQSEPRILDLCTGSGCIAIACALHLPEAQVDAVDISAEALTVAARNIKHHQVEDRVHLIQSDLFDGLAEGMYDLIVSNPPYIDEADLLRLPMEYKHEPQLGLSGGKDGLDIIRRILARAGRYLSDNGVLIVEVGRSAQRLSEVYPDLPVVWLSFQRGGDGVFLLRKDELLEGGGG